jgi:hypothetical protein
MTTENQMIPATSTSPRHSVCLPHSAFVIISSFVILR